MPPTQQRKKPNWKLKNSAVINNNNNIGQKNTNPNNKNGNNSNATDTNNWNDRKPRTVYPRSETRGRTNHSSEQMVFGADAANRLPPRNGRPMGQSQNQQQETQNKIYASA